MSSSPTYIANASAAANINAASTAGWIPLPRGGGGSIGFQVIISGTPTGTIVFEVTNDENPMVSQGVILGPTPIVLAAPLLAASTPAGAPVNFLFEFSPGTANPCPDAKWIKMRYSFGSGTGTANVGVS